MKNHFLMVLILIPFGSRTQGPGFEFHASVNHPLSSTEDRTFFGGGGGATILFRDTRIFNFKTGIEVNYFHTWDETAYGSKMWNKRNVHYDYTVLSFPAFARLTFGDQFKLYLEAGAYVGICLNGQEEFKISSYTMSPDNPLQSQVLTESSYNTGLSITPAVGLGVRFPLSERIDLFLKPEFAFVRNSLGEKGSFSQKNNYNPSNGGTNDFNFSYMYVRFCAGIHLKPKKG